MRVQRTIVVTKEQNVTVKDQTLNVTSLYDGTYKGHSMWV